MIAFSDDPAETTETSDGKLPALKRLTNGNSSADRFGTYVGTGTIVLFQNDASHFWMEVAMRLSHDSP